MISGTIDVADPGLAVTISDGTSVLGTATVDTKISGTFSDGLHEFMALRLGRHTVAVSPSTVRHPVGDPKVIASTDRATGDTKSR